MFFKSQRQEYFVNCGTLGLDVESEFSIDDVLEKVAQLIESDKDNETAYKISGAYFIKYMPKVIKWRKTEKFQLEKAQFDAKMNKKSFYDKLMEQNEARVKEKKTGDFLDGE